MHRLDFLNTVCLLDSLECPSSYSSHLTPQHSQAQKSNNLQYNTYAGSLGPWDKQLIDQVSDVPRTFYHNFLQNSLQKSFQFIFL